MTGKVQRHEKFEPRGCGPVAIEPSAFGMLFMIDEPPEATVRDDGTAVVPVHGPLMHHEDWLFDSYDSVRARVADVLERGAKTVVLSLDSPGGLVSGCFETVEALRQMCADKGAPLVAYIDGQACSGAYALACAAERIVMPRAAAVGSIGVMAAIADITSMQRERGVRVEVITSGARKADGNPSVPITDEAMAAVQKRVDDLAEVFFDAVANSRRMTPDDVRILQASVVHGNEALRIGLVDEVASMDQLLASIASGENVAASAAQGAERMASKIEEAKKMLRDAAENSDNDEDKKAAQAALSAMDDDEKKDDDKPSDEGKAEDGGDDKKSDPPPPPSKDDDEEGKSKVQDPAAIAAKAARAEVEAFMRAESEKSERMRLIAERQDFSDATKKMLASAPLEHVREYVKSEPRRALRPAASAIVSPTAAEGRGDARADRLPPEEAHALDVRMGLTSSADGPRVEGNKQFLPVMTREQARARLERKESTQGR